MTTNDDPFENNMDMVANIHKVHLQKDLKRMERVNRKQCANIYNELPKKEALRAFFRKPYKRREAKEPEYKVKYTVFLEPVPFFVGTMRVMRIYLNFNLFSTMAIEKPDIPLFVC